LNAAASPSISNDPDFPKANSNQSELMKANPSALCLLSFGLLCGFPQASAQVHAEAKADTKAEGSHSSSFKKTVTVTSDGKNTIKKTVITRDGVEETLTEITDEKGRVTIDGKLPGGGLQVDGEGGKGRVRIDGNPKQDDLPDRDTVEEGAGDDRPWLGVRVKEAPQVLRDQLDFPEDEGVVVDVVADKGPGAKAGIVPGDLLLRFGDQAVATPAELESALRDHVAGETVTVDLLRKGQRQEAGVVLEPRPEEEPRDGAPPQGLQDKAGKGGGGAKAEVEVDGKQGGLDAVLDDNNLPEDFKELVREMKKAMEEFERKQGGD
jgi:membrane-associated protease RseP (regulator of RpoE activity)